MLVKRAQVAIVTSVKDMDIANINDPDIYIAVICYRDFG